MVRCIPRNKVNAMLDLVKQETMRIDSRFLVSTCGNGNFLAEVLKRKLAIVETKYKKVNWNLSTMPSLPFQAYMVVILEDNAQECRERLFKFLINNTPSCIKMNARKNIAPL